MCELCVRACVRALGRRILCMHTNQVGGEGWGVVSDLLSFDKGVRPVWFGSSRTGVCVHQVFCVVCDKGQRGGIRRKGRIERLRVQLAYGFEARTQHQLGSSWHKSYNNSDRRLLRIASQAARARHHRRRAGERGRPKLVAEVSG